LQAQLIKENVLALLTVKKRITTGNVTLNISLMIEAS